MDILSKKFKSLLGPKGWIPSSDSLPWQRDWLDQYGEIPLGVARPKSSEELQAVLKLCNSENIFAVPQGGNTGLVGSSVLNSSGGIIISLSRMNSILNLDITSGTISVESGVILETLHSYLNDTQQMFPMHLGSEGSAQIGGLIATNAGGSHAFRYGMMQDLVLGLEVVLADGTIWNGMRSVQKDNAGYQLRKVFCGSEGTLGVVSKAILKLVPKPKQSYTALLAFEDASELISTADNLRNECGEFLSALEFFSDIGLEIALNHIDNLIFPLQKRTKYYLLVELGSISKEVPLDNILTKEIEKGIEKNIIADGSIASSESQKKVFWRLRDEQPEGQKRLGPQLKHDLSVPPSKLVDFLISADKICNQIMPNVKINSFGHIGDGNIHYNLSPPEGQKSFNNTEKEFAYELGKLVTKMGGSFAAEHGIGRSKIELTDLLRDPVERELMRKIKKSIDKKNNLNPDVLISIN